MCWASMIASAAPTSVAARSKSPRSVAMAASPLMANGLVNSSPMRSQISRASRASDSAASRFPSWRSTMLRLLASDATRNSLPVARTSASRCVIHSRASGRSPAIWAPTPRRWSAFERPGSSSAPSLTASASRASRRPSATSVAKRHAGEATQRLRDHRPHRRAGGRSRGHDRKARPRGRPGPSRTA